MTGLVELAAGPSPLWYATRAGGSIALVLLTATVTLGIAVGGRYAPQPLARFEISNLHRNLSVMTLVFLVIHILTSIADTFVHLGWFVAVIPFSAAYRTLWLGLGTVAFDLLLAVAATSAVRLRLGHHRWKSVHWLAYAAWPFAIFHGAGTGTDTQLSLQLVLYALCLLTVIAAVCWRLYRAGPGRVAARVWAGVATAVLPVALAAFVTSGPLQPGWASRAAGPTTAPVTGPARHALPADASQRQHAAPEDEGDGE
jgi:predicted ferric reductase